MAHTPHAEDFRRSLAQAATNGTLRSFGKGTPLAGRVWAKTGSMRDVVCLAGYYHSASGRRYAFALMLNKAGASYTRVMNLYSRLLQQLP
jgi:D-alanyl-D-alanine carboxypeptidase/D-alanyl-D-alanine-endopeptidase (penicillin-binding protein 4)